MINLITYSPKYVFSRSLRLSPIDKPRPCISRTRVFELRQKSAAYTRNNTVFSRLKLNNPVVSEMYRIYLQRSLRVSLYLDSLMYSFSGEGFHRAPYCPENCLEVPLKNAANVSNHVFFWPKLLSVL